MTRKQEILEAIFGEEQLAQYKLLGYKKFSAYEISPVQILMFIPEAIQQKAEENLNTKVFFEEDVYFTAIEKQNMVTGPICYGIGVDPDKNSHFMINEE